MECIKTEPDPDAEVYSASCREIQHIMEYIKTELDPDAEVNSPSCSEIQHIMECIKTEPDPDAEVHSPSCSEIQLADIKQEEQPLSIIFSPAKDGNDVSCQCVCC
jgi:hypothetical protein